MDIYYWSARNAGCYSLIVNYLAESGIVWNHRATPRGKIIMKWYFICFLMSVNAKANYS